MNSNIMDVQDILTGEAVHFPPLGDTPTEYYGEGIEYNCIDTFTIKTTGLYSLTCVLSIHDATDEDTCFYVELNGTSPVAGTAHLGNSGQLVLNRVGQLLADTTVRIVNGSGHTIKLANATGNTSSTGHFSLFKFADAGVGNDQARHGNGRILERAEY